MKATELRKGMIVQTGRGRKTVQSAAPTNTTLLRVAFTDGDICLCRPDTIYKEVNDNDATTQKGK